jgi:hypothetical protein
MGLEIDLRADFLAPIAARIGMANASLIEELRSASIRAICSCNICEAYLVMVVLMDS